MAKTVEILELVGKDSTAGAFAAALRSLNQLQAQVQRMQSQSAALRNAFAGFASLNFAQSLVSGFDRAIERARKLQDEMNNVRRLTQDSLQANIERRAAERGQSEPNGVSKLFGTIDYNLDLQALNKLVLQQSRESGRPEAQIMGAAGALFAAGANLQQVTQILPAAVQAALVEGSQNIAGMGADYMNILRALDASGNRAKDPEKLKEDVNFARATAGYVADKTRLSPSEVLPAIKEALPYIQLRAKRDAPVLGKDVDTLIKQYMSQALGTAVALGNQYKPGEISTYQRSLEAKLMDPTDEAIKVARGEKVNPNNFYTFDNRDPLAGSRAIAGRLGAGDIGFEKLYNGNKKFKAAFDKEYADSVKAGKNVYEVSDRLVELVNKFDPMKDSAKSAMRTKIDKAQINSAVSANPDAFLRETARMNAQGTMQNFTDSEHAAKAFAARDQLGEDNAGKVYRAGTDPAQLAKLNKDVDRVGTSMGVMLDRLKSGFERISNRFIENVADVARTPDGNPIKNPINVQDEKGNTVLSHRLPDSAPLATLMQTVTAAAEAVSDFIARSRDLVNTIVRTSMAATGMGLAFGAMKLGMIATTAASTALMGGLTGLLGVMRAMSRLTLIGGFLALSYAIGELSARMKDFSIASFVDAFRDLDFITQAAAVFGSVAVAIGVLGPVVTAAATALTGLAAAATAAGAALAPIVAIVAAVAIGAYGIRASWSAASETIGRAAAAFVGVYNAARDLHAGIAGLDMSAIGTALVNGLQSGVTALYESAKVVGLGIVTGIGAIFGADAPALWKKLESGLDVFVSSAVANVQRIGSAIAELASSIPNPFASWVDSLSSAIDKLKALLGMSTGAKPVVPDVRTPQGLFTAPQLQPGDRSVINPDGTEDYIPGPVAPKPQTFQEQGIRGGLRQGAGDAQPVKLDGPVEVQGETRVRLDVQYNGPITGEKQKDSVVKLDTGRSSVG
ncbi:hypothetical protein ABB55_03295 [Prosthecomicrobium hirschii]|uniref:Uncharacterized protein n=1 Tax=Prosthecodimorpha hirschii TaxID=665126 RepID=A0A0P6WA71_9HYPH|nr:hypothetical protein [Prosthecomicrobium hirschii]KPL51371.1 hypothetical protein ABB55_03295 [Prosthecomicrobium hirschii]